MKRTPTAFHKMSFVSKFKAIERNRRQPPDEARVVCNVRIGVFVRRSPVNVFKRELPRLKNLRYPPSINGGTCDTRHSTHSNHKGKHRNFEGRRQIERRVERDLLSLHTIITIQPHYATPRP